MEERADDKFLVRVFVTDHAEWVEDFWEDWGEFDSLTGAAEAARYLKAKAIQTEITRREFV